MIKKTCLIFFRLVGLIGLCLISPSVLRAEVVAVANNSVGFIPYSIVILLLVIALLIYWHIDLQRTIENNKKRLDTLRQNENRLQAIINVSPIPLALNNARRQITFLNPAFTDLFGYTLADIPTLADWWQQAYPDPDYRQQVKDSWVAELARTRREKTPFVAQEVVIRCKDGMQCTVAITETSLQLPEEVDDSHLVILYDITMHRQTENKLQQSVALLKSVIDNAPLRIFWKDLQSHYLGCNHAFANDAGFSNPEQLIGKDDTMMSWKNHAAQYRTDDEQVMTTGVATLNFEERRVMSDNSNLWLRISKVPLFDESAQVMGLLGLYEDITARKQAEESLNLAASVFANTQEGIVITDTQGNIIDANQAFSRITGFSYQEMLGKNPSIFQSGRHDKAFYRELWQTIKNYGFWHGEVWNRRKSGEIYTEWLTISSVKNAQNEVISYIGTSSDISLLKQREQQLEQLTHYDPLTGVPNRVLLADRMSLAIAQSKRTHRLLAVCYLDLDGFQTINEQFGHSAGDQLLIEITQRIKDALREEDTVARLGGDEFACLLQDLDGIEECEHRLHRLLATIKTPLMVQEQAVTVSASVGVSIYPEDKSPPDTLLRHASQAMYQTKQDGKNAFHIYNIELDKQLHAHRTAINRIEYALANGEFELYFQPKVDMKKGVVFGAEALIRWHHLERGVVMPKDFLPLIENNEFANRLDEWVIESTLQQMEQWHSQGIQLKISINISARTLQSADFVGRLRRAFARYPVVNRQYFELEILETEVLNDLEKTAYLIKKCQHLGVQFALDDFGTGYSSLSYLRHLPIQTLKIDQSFVRDMLEDDSDLAIVRSVIGLASSFKRQVIAEGVESIEHGTALMLLGCQQAQGYAIARPMPAADFVTWLDNWQMPVEWQQANIGNLF